jgi:hypothetical protein
MFAQSFFYQKNLTINLNNTDKNGNMVIESIRLLTIYMYFCHRTDQ